LLTAATPAGEVARQSIGAGLSVGVVQERIARIHSMTPVRDFGTTLEFSAGVKEGDGVIVNPPVDLTDARKVTVRPHPRARMS
jgi:hypothetical protein